MLELTKHKQYLISKQKHSKISLYLIMLPRQLLHTHSTNYTHTCTNWLKGCDNYKLKLIIVFCTNAEIALLNLEIQRTSCWLRLWHTLSCLRCHTKNYELIIMLHNYLQYYNDAYLISTIKSGGLWSCKISLFLLQKWIYQNHCYFKCH